MIGKSYEVVMFLYIINIILLTYYIVPTNSKCLIVNIDNRQLTDKLSNNEYPSMTAVLNHHYAKR